MTAQPDFREGGEDFLEHFGKLGMKWGRRNASNESVSTSTPDPSMDVSYTTTQTQRSHSGKGKYVALAVLGIAGAVLIANTPIAKPYVNRAVENIKPIMSKLKVADVPKGSTKVFPKTGGLPLSTMPKAPVFNEKDFQSGYRKIISLASKNAKTPVKYAGFNTLRPLKPFNVFPNTGGLPLSTMPKAPITAGEKFFAKNSGLPLSSMPKTPYNPITWVFNKK